MPRTVWADGICINHDIVERSQQAAIMGEVYRKANQVITYIGPEGDHSSMAISFARRLRIQIESGSLDQNALPPLSDPGWVVLTSLTLRGWVSSCFLGCKTPLTVEGKSKLVRPRVSSQSRADHDVWSR